MDQAGKHILYAKIALKLGLKGMCARQMEKAERILVDRILRKQILGDGTMTGWTEET